MFDAKLAPILRKDQHYLQTDQKKLPLEHSYLGVPSVSSKMIPEPMVCFAQTVHLSCTDTNTTSKWTETRFDMTHITQKFIGCIQNDFRAYRTFSANLSPILCQDQHYLQIDRNELPLEPHHLGVPSRASKTISDPMVCLAQTMHLSCTDNNTVSKRTETRFDMTHVTQEFQRVRPK